MTLRSLLGAEAQVVKFFDAERESFQNQPSSRSVSRIKKLSSHITLFLQIYEYGARKRYFELVCNELKRRSSHPCVVLIDPDNGMAGKCPKSEHVCQEEISNLWSAMKPGDVLIVYQHQFRDKECVSKRRSVLATALGTDQIFCRCHDDVRSVCFFEVIKNGN